MTARPQWAVVVTVFVDAVVAAVQLGKPAPALPAIAADLGINMLTAGWVALIITK